jgi:putative ABC transport system ATP-binding protein
MTPSLFETHGLSRYFRPGTRAEVRALDDVSVTVARGSFTVLTGPSGSGKTTLLALLGALDRPTKGRVVFDGRDVGPLSDVELTRVRRRVGFVFQDFPSLAGLPVWENVTYPLIPRGVPRRERYRLADGLLARLGLADKLLARTQELSGGEQQRVGLARALVGDPDVVLADEPTSNLDAESAGAVLDQLRAVHQAGKTVVAASHDPAVLALATAAHHLRAGRLGPGPVVGMPKGENT